MFICLLIYLFVEEHLWAPSMNRALQLQGVLALPCWEISPATTSRDFWPLVLFQNLASANSPPPSKHLQTSLILVPCLTCLLHFSSSFTDGFFISLISLESSLRARTVSSPSHYTSLWYIGKVQWKKPFSIIEKLSPFFEHVPGASFSLFMLYRRRSPIFPSWEGGDTVILAS